MRGPGKKFSAGHHEGTDFIWNIRDVRRVLYKLPELVKRKNEIVYIVEGEQDTDRLLKEGLLATTNSHGPGKWRDDYSESLKDRDVVIIPDNDEEGKSHAEKVAKSLAKKARSIKIVELPGLPEHADVSDWLDAGNTIESLKALVDKSPEIQSEDQEEDDSKLKQLVKMIEGTGIEPLRDLRNMAYVALPKKDGNKIIPVRSPMFESWTQHLAWTQMEWPMTDQSLKAVARIMECKGLYDGKEYDLRIRAARHEGDNWNDIDGNTGVHLKEGSWEVEDNPRIFKSLPHQRNLPIPDHNGNYELIEKYMTRIKNENDRILFICWLHVCFIADIEIPMLSLWGSSKAGKSTLQRVIRRLIDPCYPEFQDKNIAVQDIPIIASQHRMLCFDNPRNLKDNQSDFLCGSVTGDGSEKRLHYKDESILGREYQNIITISSVPCIVTESDLVNRSILIEFDQSEAEENKKKSAIWEELERDAPFILGGIFNNLAKALLIVGNIDLKSVSRFVEFTEIAAAVAEVIGIGADRFFKCYRDKLEGQSQDLAESDSVFIALKSLHSKISDFEKSPTATYESLTQEARTLDLDMKAWPKSPNKLTERLKYLNDSFRAVGLIVETGRKTNRRFISVYEDKKLLPLSNDGSKHENDCQNQTTVMLEGASIKADDGHDGHDDGMTKIPVVVAK